MPDPVTIGALAASALGMAGEAFLKGAVGEIAKDAYKALKAKIATWAGNDVEALEKTPTSPARQAVVAEAVDGQSADDQAAVRALADRLIAALRAAGPVGIDVGRLDALAVKLGAIAVTSGTGLRLAEARVLGTFETGDISVGPDAGKK
jgi:hypothetical protein